MWVMNRDGFFSIVKHDTIPDTLLVRARARKDLEHLALALNLPAAHGNIIELPPPVDYEFRMNVDVEEFARYMGASVGDIDYRNFKNAVTDIDKKRAHVYMDVWYALLAIGKKHKRVSWDPYEDLGNAVRGVAVAQLNLRPHDGPPVPGGPPPTKRKKRRKKA